MSSWLDTGLLLALPSRHLSEKPQAVFLCGSLGGAHSQHAGPWSWSYESPGRGCAHGSRGGRAGQQPGGRCPHLEGGRSRGPGWSALLWGPGYDRAGRRGRSGHIHIRVPTVGVCALVVADVEGPGDPARAWAEDAAPPPTPRHELPQESNGGLPQM